MKTSVLAGTSLMTNGLTVMLPFTAVFGCTKLSTSVRMMFDRVRFETPVSVLPRN